jgi:hypothetical protein
MTLDPALALVAPRGPTKVQTERGMAIERPRKVEFAGRRSTL